MGGRNNRSGAPIGHGATPQSARSGLISRPQKLFRDEDCLTRRPRQATFRPNGSLLGNIG